MSERLAHIRDRELQKRLLAEELLNEEQIQALLTRQNELYQSSHEQLRGQLYEINLEGHELEIKQSIELNMLNTVDLALDLDTSAQWQRWGHQIPLLHPEKPELLEMLNWRPTNAFGLTLGDKLNYLYSPDLSQQKHLVLSRHLLDPRMSETPTKTGPYDLFLAASRDLLCLVDRGAGEIYLIDPSSYEVSDIFTIRDRSSQKAIVLEPNPAHQRIFFVDQLNPTLGILDYAEGMLEEHPLEGCFPVHLQLSDTSLYVLVSEPAPEILRLDAQNLQVQARVRLPGELYQEHHLTAANPFLFSASGQWLAVLVGQNPNAELIWLDALSLSILERKILAGQPRPLMLALGQKNPLASHRKRLAELIVEEGLLEPDVLLRFFPPPLAEGKTELEIIGPDSDVMVSAEATERPLSEIVPETPRLKSEPEPEPEREVPMPTTVPPPAVPTARAESGAEPRIEASLLYFSPIESFTSLPEPKPAENLPLPPIVVTDIMHILSGAFYQQHGIDLQYEPEVLERLKNNAWEYKIELQDHAVWPVDIPDLIVGHKLRTILLRELILTLLELRQTPNRYPYDTPPTHCPECHVPLLGRWDCESCGLELLSPERSTARRVASATARTWLPPGYFAIPEVQSGRLLLINTHHHDYITWQMDFRNLPGLRQPWDMLLLADMHMLLTDRLAHRVLELSATGRKVWELDSEQPEFKLNHPVKATAYDPPEGRHYLIVDQGNHRILEVNGQHQLCWSFGVRGELGSDNQHLYLPTDVQYTPEQTYLITDTGNDRVLEVSGQRVIRTWGLGLKLKRPVFAQRLVNRHTLIADAGNYRLLEINTNGEVVRELVYFRPGMDERFDMAYPLKVMRRENQNVVLIDSNRVMEVDLISKKIVWFSFLHELKLELELPTRLHQREVKVSQSGGQEVYRPVLDAEHMTTVRRTLQKLPLFAEAPGSFLEALEAQLKFRRYWKGETLLRRGQAGHAFFILQSGRVGVVSGDSEEPGLYLEAGDSFGFMGIIYREPRKSSVICLEACGVYILEKRDFDALLVKYPQIGAKVRKMAAERLLVSRLKQTPKSPQAAERLKTLMAQQRLRAHERMARITGPLRAPDGHEAHRLNFSEIEQRVIAAAREEGQSCLELHINLSPKTRMKSARVALIASLLDKTGTIIRTEPTPEAILEEKFEQEVVMAVLTQLPLEQVSEDLLSIADVASVDVFPVEVDGAVDAQTEEEDD